MSDSPPPPYQEPKQKQKASPAIMALQEGTRLHRGGKLAEAAAAYDRALAVEPENADALHLRGMIACQMGNATTGLGLLRQAVALSPLAQFQNSLGLALTTTGDLDGAGRAFAEALRLNPKYADAHINSGNLVRRQGNIEAALGHYRQAVTLQPAHANALCLLGTLLDERGEHEQALPHLEKAIKLQPNDARMIAAFGVALMHLRRPAAEELFTRALALNPKEVEALVGLTQHQLNNHRPRQAVETAVQAMSLAPARADIRSLYGRALMNTDRLDEAKAAYEAALALEPRLISAMTGLSALAKMNGDFTAARAYAEAALETSPSSSAALAALASLDDVTLSQDQLARAEKAAEDTGLRPDERQRLHFALFRHRQQEDAYDDAFRHLAAANTLRLDELARRGCGYDPVKITGNVDHVIATFDADYFARASAHGSDSDVPVFIVGMPRSGTTLVEQILASHSRVFGAGELNDIEDVVTRLLATAAGTGETSPEATLAGTPELLRQEAGRYLARLKTLAPTARRVTDKMPGNFMNLGIIALLFPRAHIIHCRRDPMDTALSCYIQSFGADIPWSWDLASVGHYYRQYERMMAHWRKALPLPIHEVVYESLVENTEQEARALIAHCGLDWEDACLEFHKTQRPIRTASVIQVRKPIYKESVGRWHHYERHLDPLRRALAGEAT